MMSRFKNGQRVRISRPGHPLVGRPGLVVRLRMGDNGAFVNMDEDPGETEFTLFPVGDPRRNHLLLYPGECEVAE